VARRRPVKAPKNPREWMAELARLYADIGSGNRDVDEARLMVKTANAACDFAHAENRRAAMILELHRASPGKIQEESLIEYLGDKSDTVLLEHQPDK
jgi:hypothetical protein